MLEVLLMQAIGRVRCLSQKCIVKIYNYTVLNSFNIKQLENNLIKMISDLVAELNDELFNITFNIDTKKLILTIECVIVMTHYLSSLTTLLTVLTLKNLCRVMS